jgi:hypothetical protein
VTVGLGCSIKNFDFSFLGQVFQYCLLGLKSVSVEDRINLGSNDYLWLGFDQKCNFVMDLKHNIVLAF